jgi:hypothetical protein
MNDSIASNNSSSLTFQLVPFIHVTTNNKDCLWEREFSQLLAADEYEVPVFCSVAQCSLLHRGRRFGETNCKSFRVEEISHHEW